MFKQEPKLVINIEATANNSGLSIFKNNHWQFVDKPVNLFIPTNADGKVDLDSFMSAMTTVRCGSELGRLDLANLSQVINRLILDKDLRGLVDKFPILIGRNGQFRIVLKILMTTLPQFTPEILLLDETCHSVVKYKLTVEHNHVEVGRTRGESHSTEVVRRLLAYVNENYDLFNGTRTQLSMINKAIRLHAAEVISRAITHGDWTERVKIGEFEFWINVETV